MNNKITFPELIEHVAATTNTSKRMSELFLKELFATISQALINGENVRIKNLGQFKLEEVKPRKSVSVNTGESVEIPSHKRLVFVPAKTLAERINKPFAHFGTEMLDDDVTDELLEAIDIEMSTPNQDDEQQHNDSDDAAAAAFVAPVMETPQAHDEETTDDEDSEETTQETTDSEAGDEVAVTPPPFIPALPDTENEDETPVSETEQETHEVTPPAPPIFAPANEQEDEPATEQEDDPATEQEEVPSEETVQEETTEDEQPEATVSPVMQSVETEQNDTPADENYNDEGYDYSTVEFEREKCEIVRKSTLRGICYGALGTLLLLLLGWGVYMLGFSHGADQAKTESVQSSTEGETPKTQDAKNDSVNKTDTIAAEQAQVEEPAPAKVVTDTCTEHLYLTRMSKKHYGTHYFWVYIYEENKDKIENPNNIPPGTVVVIPPAEKYGIDAKDPESVKKAHKKETELYNKYPPAGSKRSSHRHRK